MATTDPDQVQIKIETPILEGEAMPEIARPIWDEYFQACLKDSELALQRMLEAGRPYNAEPHRRDTRAESKADTPAIATTPAPGAGAAEVESKDDAPINDGSITITVDEKSAPTNNNADNSPAVTRAPTASVSASSAPTSADPAAAAASPNTAAGTTEGATPVPAPLTMPRSHRASRASVSRSRRAANLMNWPRLNAANESESKRADREHIPLKEKLFEAYDVFFSGGEGQLDVGVMKMFVVEALQARRRIVTMELQLLFASTVASAIAVARTMGVAPNVLQNYDAHIHGKLNPELPEFIKLATGILDKAIHNAENLSIQLFTALDADKDGKVRKDEFLSEWKYGFDELVDYQPILIKIRKLIC